MKAMNIKMAINTYLSTIESEKQTKQTRTETESWIQRVFCWLQMGGWYEGMGEAAKGVRNTKRQLQNSHADVKYSIGHGEAKGLVHLTYGHEQWWGLPEGVGQCWVEEGKEGIIRKTIIA